MCSPQYNMMKYILFFVMKATYTILKDYFGWFLPNSCNQNQAKVLIGNKV
jgi:hypothetical protein